MSGGGRRERRWIIVSVSEHAARQARARSGRDVTDVVRDARLALCEERVSAERSAFLGGGPVAHRDALHVWNLARTVAYVVREDYLGSD